MSDIHPRLLLSRHKPCMCVASAAC
jgi:hypothetical protein